MNTIAAAVMALQKTLEAGRPLAAWQVRSFEKSRALAAHGTPRERNALGQKGEPCHQ